MQLGPRGVVNGVMPLVVRLLFVGRLFHMACTGQLLFLMGMVLDAVPAISFPSNLW